MTKQLTQDVFKDAPKAKCIAIDSDGEAWAYNLPSSKIKAYEDYWAFHGLSWGEYRLSKTWLVGTGYDTTDWQHSAIDRE